jgi:hypothetical protein
MTAEVAVMNKLAVALAADSAVTFGGPNQQKIYNAANKLFSLSKREPVGVMIYGSAEVMGIPWEAILKIFREELGDTAFGTLSEYFDHFVAFLGDSDRFFDAPAQERFVQRNAGSYFVQLRKTVFKRVEETIEAQGAASESEVASVVDSVISEHARALDMRPFATGIDGDHLQYLIATYDEPINEAIKLVFQQLPLTPQQTAQLVYVGASLFARNILPASRSGIVIAGFGQLDHFPRLRAIELDGRIGSKLHYNVV